MACVQVKIYVTYIAIQILIAISLIGRELMLADIFGPLIGGCIIYLLCSYKHYTIATVLVSIAIVLGIATDIYYFKRKDGVKHLLYAHVSNREKIMEK